MLHNGGVCEYCGCHQNPYIGELMEEHDRLVSLGDSVVRALRHGDDATARTEMVRFAALLQAHNEVEERGMFAAMRQLGEFVELIEQLAAEHRDLHARLDGFGDDAPPIHELGILLDDLADHIEKENRGVFPFAYSAFSTREWVTVEHAHR